MFFEPERVNSVEELAAIGLKRSPITSLVVPGPIGWISTLSRDGVANLAPFSFFNMVSQRPPMVMFCDLGAEPLGSAPEEFAAHMAEYVKWGRLVKEAGIAPE
jgi:hypothetical protein